MKKKFKFELIYLSKKSKARVGKIHTKHGIINTPNFVAVGTNGTLKALDNVFLEKLNQELMFCNTYHLILHPGTKTIEQAGGIHNFINRKSPIITDSGGFQVFSLAYGSVKNELKSKGQKQINNSVIKIDEQGVKFRSYRNGDLILLTPESSIQAQKEIGADIIIPFDELLPYHIAEKKLQTCLDRTHRWEERSLNEHFKNPKNQAIYAVIHGGINKKLRKKSCEFLTKLPFDGYSIGGSIGKNLIEMVEIVDFTLKQLPLEKPNHLLGIGDLKSIEKIIPLGIDTFDSSYPTRSARHGHLYTKYEIKKITQTKYKNIFKPIEENCSCYTCQNYTLAYLHHLYKTSEPIILNLTTIHNIFYMNQLMKNYRQKILNDKI